jgi:hypothetical protein
MLDPLMENYKQATSLPSLDESAKQALAVLEAQLAWMVSIGRRCCWAAVGSFASAEWSLCCMLKFLEIIQLGCSLIKCSHVCAAHSDVHMSDTA